MKHKTDHFRGAHGEELFFQTWHPDKPALASLVIVHGFSDHCDRYINLVNGLVPRNIIIYTFDQRGHGHSPGSRGHIDSFSEFRDDLQLFMQLVASKEPESPLFLFGQSMGGLIVLDYGLHYPQGLNGIIASAPHLSDPPVSPILEGLGRILSGIWPAISFNVGLDENGISRDVDVVQTYRNDPLVHGKATARFSTELSAAVDATQANAANFEPPLLIYHGSADRLTSPEASRDFYEKVGSENKHYIRYEGGYHEGHNDLHQERVIIDVGQWIEEQVRIISQQPQELE